MVDTEAPKNVAFHKLKLIKFPDCIKQPLSDFAILVTSAGQVSV
jgi:hypothetical protein